jgi:D-serine deaminase-like pyridoxal phosphate-dependent protein
MHVSELDTPALLIDLDIFERNLRRVADYAKEHDLRLRPHTKTHKVPAVGKLQLESGAVGLTVAKVGEAEVMLGSGTPDLLVAYPVIGRSKLERLAEVAKKTRVTVSLDSSIAARQLSEAARQAQVSFGVLAEVDVGLGRVGVAPGEELLQLAQVIERLPRLSFEGIAFYPGQIRTVGDDGPEEEALRQLGRTVRTILDDFRRAGMEVRVVSGGSTPTLYRSHEIAGLNEIRPGTYVYNDVNTVRTGTCGWEDCAVTILATVVSTARKGHMIIDGGSKTFSSDRLVGSAELSFGRVVESPESVFHNLNEEHGYVDIRRAETEFSIGDRVHVIPNHACVAVNLHEKVYGVRKDSVEQVWKVEGRGKLQ